MNDSLITSIGAQPASAPRPTVQDRKLREACEKFEGMLLGIMMKESMGKTLSKSAGDAAPGLDSFRDFCIEQVAHTLAENSSLGIADQLYADLGIEGGGQ